MVDFDKNVYNSDKFRQAALYFERHGHYCPYPTGTTEYIKYWDEEKRRSLDGYTADDGDWISGYYYFYLNYCPIDTVTEVKKIDRFGKTIKKRVHERNFPSFYDYDFYFFWAVQEAEDANKHLCVLKSRRKGYSYKCSAMLCRNYFLISESKSYAYANGDQYLTKDGILTKAWDCMAFIDDNTAWAKKRQKIDTTMHKRSSLVVTDEVGNKVEIGYKSEIIGVTIKSDPDKVRGKAGNLFLFEEAGKNPVLLDAWEIVRPSAEQDGVAHALIIAFGTGGSGTNDFAGLQEMFYNPDSFNCLGFDNIWDDNATGSKCGFFIPQYANLDIRDDDGNRLYMDKDGNTLKEAAYESEMLRRKPLLDNAKSSATIDRFVAENCLTPAEACLELSGNIFPKKELQQQLSLIRTNKKLQNHKQVGDLDFVNGELVWTNKKQGDITKYPLGKNDDPTGSIVIWEHPTPNAPHGLYVGGCLTPGEKVLTENGLMNVEDVTLEDKLINQEGNAVSINTLLRYHKCNKDVFTVKMSNAFRTTTFTREHPLYVSKTNYNSNKTINESKFNFDYVKMENVSIGDWTKIPNMYRKSRDIKPFVDVKRFWWFIGLWLGDGWCESDGYGISIVFNKCEIDYIDNYKWFVRTQLGRHPRIRTRGNAIECTFSHKEFSEYLTNTFGKYAYGKYIPEHIKYLDPQSKLDLIRGYLNSDGCITKNGKYYSMEFVSINLTLLEAVQDILFSLGYVSNLSKLRNSGTASFGRNREYKTRECYHLRVGHNDTVALAKDIIEIPALDPDSKLDKINFDDLPIVRVKPRNGCFISYDKNYIYIQIRNITKSKYTGTVYNFDCETHTYMCRDIVTHNCDPYDHDQAGTNSLGSTFIYKRFQNFEEYYDIIVAEYTARPATAEEYYENVRKLLLYYNARLLYENERKGIFPYFTQKHCDYLLAEQPDIISDIIGNSKVQRRKGIHMTKQIRAYGEGLIKEWLNEEYAPGKKNLTRILSEPLLEELIRCNDKINVDRVIALIMVMIYREQLYNNKIKDVEDNTRRQSLFDTPLFSNNDGYDIFNSTDNTPTFTF